MDPQVECPNKIDKSLPELPTEILLEIFSHLTGRQLKTARLVCWRWYQTVTSFPAILDKLKLTIPAARSRPQLSLDELTALTKNWNRYSQVRIVRVQHLEAIALKPLLGGNIRHLNMHQCRVPAQELLQMLVELPRLNHLEFAVDESYNYELQNVTEVDERPVTSDVEHLHLCIGAHQFLDLFLAICPRLKVLKLSTCEEQYQEEEFETSLIRFVHRVRHSLKSFLHPDSYSERLVRQILSIDGLVLHHLEVGMLIGSAGVVEMQPMLETIVVTLDDEDLNSIYQLTNLKKLTIFVETAPIDGLLTALQLHSLTLYRGRQVLFQSEIVLSNVISLTLRRCGLSCSELQQIVKMFPNMNHLALIKSGNINLHDVLVITSQLNNLRILSIDIYNPVRIDPSYHMDDAFKSIWSLRELHLRGQFDYNELAAAVPNYPRLLKIRLTRVFLPDKFAYSLCCALRNVPELRFEQCHPISDAMIDCIIDHCRALEKLTIYRCGSISRHAKEKLHVANDGRFKVMLDEDVEDFADYELIEEIL